MTERNGLAIRLNEREDPERKDGRLQRRGGGRQAEVRENLSGDHFVS